MSSEYRLHPHVIWVARPDGTSRLIHLDRNICGLDSASTRLLQDILQDGVEGATQRFAARSNRAPDAARADVAAFLDQLRSERIVLAAGEGATPTGGARAAAGRAAVGAVLCIAAAGARRARTRMQARVLLWSAYWAVRCLGWGTTVRLWDRLFPRPRADAAPGQAPDLNTIDVHVRDVAARSLLPLECKERALASLALARESGAPADLVIGLRYVPLQAHVWASCDGRIVGDDAEVCRTYEALEPLSAGTVVAGATAPTAGPAAAAGGGRP